MDPPQTKNQTRLVKLEVPDLDPRQLNQLDTKRGEHVLRFVSLVVLYLPEISLGVHRLASRTTSL